MANYLSNFNFNSVINNAKEISGASPDQMIGCIRNGQFNLCNSRINLNYNNNLLVNYQNISNRPIILIILESPHISEFNNNIPIGSMMNKKTIQKFNNKLMYLLQRSCIYNQILKNNYNVVIMNSVQYQCSLGAHLNNSTNKEIRDKNWVTCYTKNCKYDLKERIKLVNPKIVINLCTKGFKNLQMILDRDLFDFCKKHNITYTYGSHPTTWNFSYAFIN